MPFPTTKAGTILAGDIPGEPIDLTNITIRDESMDGYGWTVCADVTIKGVRLNVTPGASWLDIKLEMPGNLHLNEFDSVLINTLRPAVTAAQRRGNDR